MKKQVIVFGLVALFGLGLVSCKKDCTCTAEGVSATTSNVKKSDCKDYTESAYGYTVNVHCTWGD